MNTLKLAITTLFTLALALVPAVPVLAQSQSATQDPLCAGVNLDATKIGSADCTVDQEGAATSVNDLVTLVINIFSWIVGVVSVIMIIWGGFKYITSGGESGGVTSAKNTILYAIVGLIIVALAQLIVRFVLGGVTGALDGSV